MVIMVDPSLGSDSGGGRKKQKADPERSVWIGNLTGVEVSKENDEALMYHMKHAGDCTWAEIHRNGTGVASFTTPEDAQNAIQTMNKSTFMGQTIEVDKFWQSRPSWPKVNPQMIQAMMKLMMGGGGSSWNAGGGGGSSWGGGASGGASGGGMPDVKQFTIYGGTLINEGFNPTAIGVPHSKDATLFSDAHNILHAILCKAGSYDYTESVVYDSDPDASLFPEVYQAWLGAGGDENVQWIAKVQELGKFGVGYGGKDKGKRAAKLALAINIALESDNTESVVHMYPSFAKLLKDLGPQVRGGNSSGGGNSKSQPPWKVRAKPY